VAIHVSLADFSAFVSALEGNDVKITTDNFKGLSLLCDEFHFHDLSAALRQFRDSDDFKKVGTVKDASLQCRPPRIEADRALVGNPSPEKTHSKNLQPLLCGEGDKAHHQFRDVKERPKDRFEEPSTIVPDFPAIFAEFKAKRFNILWRGSRDGFAAREFHNRCDGYANTLAVILDTDGNIFGGFTPVKWESREFKGDGSNLNKADPSLKSFIFTLKNPHNFPARRFALKAEAKDRAIRCWSDKGPSFHDICVFDQCDKNIKSYTFNFGDRYTNDTGLDGKTFFTGSKEFQVREIEVFEIS
jgi:hypothetical protein